MNLRKNIFTALLLAVGLILHQITPGVLGSMKFDLMLSFIFVAIFINPTLNNCILTAFIGGLFTSLTTTFPGGQIPNVIDKIVTCFVVLILIKLAQKVSLNKISIGIISFIGTIVSGSVFLYSALLIVGLPAPFKALFLGIVLPTSISNVVITLVIYNVVAYSLKIVNRKASA
ncbi:tryptophan transporter [Abyssisolibacter fermentans]|uniref:tryptophan transporter n=1 Tax=Abyssisolibacter fermentans TaxID=1766203 RepID=UPI00082F8A5F|nr:tryptophan transporter [Abyssisolibacter fermentans]